MKIDNFKVEDWFNEYEKLSKYDMADTCVESLSLNELFELVGEKEKHLDFILNKRLNYGDIQGSERIKQAISSLYNNVSSENITITHGAIGANQLVMLSVIESGDKVVSILPTYQQHYSIPKAIGADVDTVFLKEENEWLPDMNELREKVTHDTKIICMNNPNNPTGSVMPESILNEIVDIARKNNAYILCDEVYRGLEHDRNISKSIVELYEKGISTGSLSKVFSLAGLRLGWIVAPDDVMAKIIVQREYNTISMSAIDDYFGTLALENKEVILGRNLPKILNGKHVLSSWVQNEPAVSWVEPKGGTTALLKYESNISSVELCKKLLSDTGVLFLPASTLEMEGYLRIGYCSNVEKLQEGLEIFSDWWRKNFII
ncbi:MAG: aminotransferase [Candidatus Gastranaerophilales bacterium]|nr:aminotransferase [Candidatus Gastranaerophilales bacterium]